MGYAVEEAEGMYEWRDGELVWHAPVAPDAPPLRPHWSVPHGGEYTPPRFSGHDAVNGCRFTQPAEVEFAGVRVEPGQG